MPTKAEKAEDKSKAQQMLKSYLPDGATIYGLITHYTDGGSAQNAHIQCLGIDGGRIVNLSLYVANLCGYRRNKRGAVILRGNITEIATDLSHKLNRKIGYGVL